MPADGPAPPDPTRLVPALARPAARRARPSLRWSTPPEDVVRRIVADQAVAFWAEPRRRVRPGPRVHFLLLPLRDVAVPGLDRDPAPGAGPEHWLVWQSLSGTGRPARLPTDAQTLTAELGVRRGRGRAVVAEALHEVMAAVYESRAT